MRNAIQSQASNLQFLTPANLAEELQIKPQTLAVWRCRGEGPPFTRCGSAIRYSRKSVQEWLAGRTATSTTALDLQTA